MLFSCCRKPQPSPTRQSARPASTEASDTSGPNELHAVERQPLDPKAIVDSIAKVFEADHKHWHATLLSIMEILEDNQRLPQGTKEANPYVSYGLYPTVATVLRKLRRKRRPAKPKKALKEIADAYKMSVKSGGSVRTSVLSTMAMCASHQMAIIADLKDLELQQFLFKRVFLGEGQEVDEAICPYCLPLTYRPQRPLLSHYALFHQHQWLCDLDHAVTEGYTTLPIHDLQLAPSNRAHPGYPQISRIMIMIWSLNNITVQRRLYGQIFLGGLDAVGKNALCPYCHPYRPDDLHAHYLESHGEKWQADRDYAILQGYATDQDITDFANGRN